MHDNSKPRTDTKHVDGAIHIISYILVVFCFYNASVRTFQNLFHELDKGKIAVSVMPAVILLVPMILAIRLTQEFDKGSIKKAIRLLVLVGYVVITGLVFFMKGGQFLSGFGKLRWYVCKAINSYYRMNFYVEDTLSVHCGFAIGIIMFVVMAITLYLALILETRMLLVIIPVLSYTATMAVGYAPKMDSVMFFFAGILLASSTSWEHYQTAYGADKSVKKIKSYIVTAVFAVMIPILSSALLEKKTEVVIIGAGPKLKQMQRDLEDNLRDKFGSDIRKIAEKFEGREKESITNVKPVYDDVPVFKVSLSKTPRENLYFREFYGMTYKNGAWNSNFDVTEAYTTAKDYSSTCGARFQSAVSRIFGVERYNLSGVIYYEDKGTSAYVPDVFEIIGAVSDYPGAEIQTGLSFEGEYVVSRSKNDDSMRFGGYEANLTDVLNHPWTYNDLYSRVSDDEYACKNYTSGSNAVSTASDIAGKLKESIHLNDSLPYADSYMKNIYRICSAVLVSNYLSNFAYNQDLARTSSDKDMVEYFLADSHEGFCIHFASAGTLILQEMGVPARYASGYVVSKRDFNSVGDNGMVEAVVLDNSAHAWTEIYLDNIGWFPVEMTTGYNDRTDELSLGEDSDYFSVDEDRLWQINNDVDDVREPNDKVPADITTETTENTSETTEGTSETTEDAGNDMTTETSAVTNPTLTDAQVTDQTGVVTADDDARTSDDETSGGDKNTNQIVKYIILYGILIVAAIGLFTFIFRKYRYSEKKIRAMKETDTKKALFYVNENIMRLLRRKQHLIKKNCSDREYEDMLIASMPDVDAGTWRRYTELIQRAMFSSHEIEAADVEFAMELCYGRK